VENFSLRIPEEHPAADQLRRKLTITKGKQQRGLISPEEAERQRSEVHRVLGAAIIHNQPLSRAA
jgi:hypothetical protein